MVQQLLSGATAATSVSEVRAAGLRLTCSVITSHDRSDSGDTRLHSSEEVEIALRKWV
jgi:hypothetical protein